MNSEIVPDPMDGAREWVQGFLRGLLDHQQQPRRTSFPSPEDVATVKQAQDRWAHVDAEDLYRAQMRAGKPVTFTYRPYYPDDEQKDRTRVE
jgi:hypothetical protein